MKIVISLANGFQLSEKATQMLGMADYRELNRHDTRLVELVEQLGEAAEVWPCQLGIVEIPDSSYYYIITECFGDEEVYFSESPITKGEAVYP